MEVWKSVAGWKSSNSTSIFNVRVLRSAILNRITTNYVKEHKGNEWILKYIKGPKRNSYELTEKYKEFLEPLYKTIYFTKH